MAAKKIVLLIELILIGLKRQQRINIQDFFVLMSEKSLYLYMSIVAILNFLEWYLYKRYFRKQNISLSFQIDLFAYIILL